MTHTSTEQPEALRLAAWCDNFGRLTPMATELRRLHARVQELESWQETVRSNSALLNRLERAELRVVELEAAQTQRAPLTDSEIELAMAWCDVCEGDHVLGAFSAGVRHVEKLCGITQEKQG